jgi:uncharacterized protein YdeI (YjbR/CyaY-like superfamily)
MGRTQKDLPILNFPSQQDWEAWLEENHAGSGGLWIKFARKGSRIESVTYQEAVEAALCYGWIDGQSRSFDDQFWLQRFTPRRAKSKWSKINCQRATELIAQGKMKAAGLREVEAARRDGRWEAAYDSPRTMSVPEDFQSKLDENPRARECFAGLDSRNRYAILYRIQDAKKPETRARRIEQLVSMLDEGKTLY